MPSRQLWHLPAGDTGSLHQLSAQAVRHVGNSIVALLCLLTVL